MAHIIVAIFLLAAGYRFERALYDTKAPGPLTVMTSVLLLVFVASTSGLFVYPYSESGFAKDVFIGLLSVSPIVCILYYFVSPRMPGPSLADSRPEFESFRGLYRALLLLSYCGFAYYLVVASGYGFARALSNFGTFHVYLLNRETSEAEILVRTIVLTPWPIVFFSFLYFRKHMRWFEYWASAVFCVLYILNLFFFGGRGKFVFGAVQFMLALIMLGWYRPTLSGVIKLFAGSAVFVVVVFAITMRRLEYLGDYGAYKLMSHTGVVSTALPEWFVQSPVGIVTVSAFLYFASPYNNFSFNLILMEDLPNTLGVLSFRLMNRAFSVINPEFREAQVYAVGLLRDYQVSAYGSADQWPTMFGYLVPDFGIFGAIIYLSIHAGILIYVTRQSRCLNPGLRFFVMLTVFYIAFQAFVMPITAKYDGMFRLFLIFLVFSLLRGKRRVRV